MQILPVLDLKAGQIVRGVAGRRASYRPIVSPLCDDASPTGVAQAFVDHFGLRRCYLADLDAIGGAPPDWRVYGDLLRAGISLWVDAGIDALDRARALADFAADDYSIESIIAGLESSSGPTGLAELVRCVGADRLVFSLDLNGGVPLTQAAGWRGHDAVSIARVAFELGIRRLIVLDLAGVGMNDGCSTLELCRALREENPRAELTTGGGVRHGNDLAAIAAAGCDFALVASALHDGRVSRSDVQRYLARS